MRIGIKVNRDVALAAGHDSYGIVAFEISASRLSESQRAALIAYGSIDWAGEHGSRPKGAPICDYCLQRSLKAEKEIQEYLPTEQSILDSLTALAEIDRQRKEQEEAKYEAEIQRLLSLPSLKGQYLSPREKADPRMAPALAREEQRQAEEDAQKQKDNEERAEHWRQQIEQFDNVVAGLGKYKCIRKVDDPSEHTTGGVVSCRRVKVTFRKNAYIDYIFLDSEEIDEGVAKIERFEADYLATVDWINQHGSRHLKTLLSEGIECRERYRAERLAADRPGWHWYDLITGKLVEAVNPPDEAIDLLDAAKATLPPGTAAKLCGWTDGEDEDGEWAVKSEYLGDTIVMLAGN